MRSFHSFTKRFKSILCAFSINKYPQHPKGLYAASSEMFFGETPWSHNMFCFDFSFIYMFTAGFFLFLCLYFEIKIESFKTAVG